MNYATIKPRDIANGPGVRVSLFVSGCRRHCKNCFNPETWDFGYGKPFTQETIDELLKLIEPSYIRGLSVLGGEPFEPENQAAVLDLLRQVKSTPAASWTTSCWRESTAMSKPCAPCSRRSTFSLTAPLSRN
jgi:anaerobic ribonucleoside-triphosphate reductase activating protein